jgi:hypothetical protein
VVSMLEPTSMIETQTGPGTPPTWVQIPAAHIMSDTAVVISWGSSGELKVEPSRASFTLDNSAGDYTPGKAGVKVKLGTPVRITVAFEGPVASQRFVGTIDEISLGWDAPAFATVDITATDRIKNLARVRIPAEGMFADAVNDDDPLMFYFLTDPKTPAVSALHTDPTAAATNLKAKPSALVPRTVGASSKVKWAEHDPPPGITGKSVEFEPISGNAFLLTTAIPQDPTVYPRSLLLYPVANPPIGTQTWSSGSAVACWVNVAGPPAAETFLFGTNLLYATIDASMKLRLRSPTETGNAGADAVTLGPTITAGAWHYVAIEATHSVVGGFNPHDWHMHMFTVDGVYSDPVTVATPPALQWYQYPVVLWMRVGAYGANATAVFSAAGLSLYSWGPAFYKDKGNSPDFAAHYNAATAYATADDDVGVRMIRWLGYADVAPLDRSISGSTIHVAQQDIGNASVLGLITDLVDTEKGTFDVDRATGKLRFRNRDAVWFPAAPALTLPSSVLLDGIEFTLDDGTLANDVTVTGPDEVPARSVDQASVTAYGRYTAEESTLDTNRNAPRALALWATRFGANPVPQCAQLRFDAADASSLTALLALKPGNIVRITGAPTIAPTSTIDLQVLGGTETVTRSRAVFTLDTAAAQVFSAVKAGWILGDAAGSLLGSTTVLTL